MLFHFKRIAVGAFLFGGIGFVCAYLDLIQRAVVLRVAVILTLGNGAFDSGIGVLAGGIVFHEKVSFQMFLPFAARVVCAFLPY